MSTSRAVDQERGAWRIVLDRDYGPYWLGTFLSACGTWFQSIAATLLVYRLTGSAFMVGVVTLSQLIGMVILAPWTGAVADRFDHRRVIVTVSLLGFAIASLVVMLQVLGLLDVPVLVVLLFASGVVGAFALPAQQALVARLVAPERLSSAVAMNSVTFNLARAVGPVAATAVIAAVGFGPAFLVNAVSYLAVVVAMLVIRVRGDGGTPRRRDLPGSIATLREQPVLAGLLLIVAAIAISADPFGTLAPFLAETVLGRPDTDAGGIAGAFGLGAVVAAILLRTDRTQRRMALDMLVMGAGVAALGVVLHYELALVASFVAGFAYLSAQTAATTRLLLSTPVHVRGRVMALWGVAWLGTRPFASIIDGFIADHVGPQRAAIIMALPVFVAGCVVLLAPRFHRSRAARRARTD